MTVRDSFFVLWVTGLDSRKPLIWQQGSPFFNSVSHPTWTECSSTSHTLHRMYVKQHHRKDSDQLTKPNRWWPTLEEDSRRNKAVHIVSLRCRELFFFIKKCEYLCCISSKPKASNTAKSGERWDSLVKYVVTDLPAWFSKHVKCKSCKCAYQQFCAVFFL